MKIQDYIRSSFLSAGLVFIYVSLVALFMFNAEKVFDFEPTFIIPVTMLILFIISASITGLLVLGKPIQLFFNGSIKEALTLFFVTLGWLVTFLLIIVFILLII